MIEPKDRQMLYRQAGSIGGDRSTHRAMLRGGKMVKSFALVLLAVALVVAVPAGAMTSFASQMPPPAPDYARSDAWAAQPGHPGKSGVVAPGATPPTRSAAVDVFYVHPTSFLNKDRWNQDIADRPVNRWTDASVVARQAGIFNGCCRIFAPRYRQASIMAFSDLAGDGGKAFDLAYGDVERAFDHYLRYDNHGRPFILVGHSQGSFHLARLLERRIDGTPLARRMVAAYLIGLNLSEGDFGKTYKTIQICATPMQTGCVVGWNAVLSQVDLAKQAKAAEQRYVDRYGDDPGKAILCIDPLTFERARLAAGPESSLGAVPGDPGYGPVRRLRPHSVGARCDHGSLVVSPATDLGLEPLPGGAMHYHDLGLFYADVRANAVLRSAAYLRENRHGS